MRSYLHRALESQKKVFIRANYTMKVILIDKPVIVTSQGEQLTDSWSLGRVTVLIPLILEDFLIICVVHPCGPLPRQGF